MAASVFFGVVGVDGGRDGERRTEAEKTRRRRQLRGSRIDSLGGEGEELEAELPVVSPGLGAAGFDGEVRRPAAHGSSEEN